MSLGEQPADFPAIGLSLLGERVARPGRGQLGVMDGRRRCGRRRGLLAITLPRLAMDSHYEIMSVFIHDPSSLADDYTGSSGHLTDCDR
jgi:hypothetical protein